MPSADRFISFNESLIERARHHPFGLALGTAAIGALLGGVVVIQALGTPKKIETAGLEPPAVVNPAETTDTIASINTVDCEQQTWPHISKACVEAKARQVRVIATDKVTDPAGTQLATSDKKTFASPGPAAAPAANIRPAIEAPAPTPAPHSRTASPSPARAPVAPVTTVGSAPSVYPQTPEPVPVIANASSQPEAVNNDVAKTSGKKSKRKQLAREREERMARAAEEARVRDGGDDEDAAPRSTARSRDRDSGRAGERWREREYDVPTADGSGQRRRVIVIERNSRSDRGEVVSRRSDRSSSSDQGFNFFGIRF